jgi:integrase
MDTWGPALAQWRTHQQAAGRSKATIRLRTSYLRRWARVCPHPWAATREAILAFLAHPSWAPESRRSARATFTTFYGWAHAEGLIGVNPATRLPSVRIPFAEPRPAPDDAIRAALAQATDRAALMVMLAAVTGLRRAEIAAVHASDLDGDDLAIVGKGGRRRILTLPQPLAAAIRARGAGWVFPSPGRGHLTPAHVGVIITRTLPAGYTPHQLRHAAASALHEQGASMFELRELLGHASVSTTQRYVRVRSRRVAGLTEERARRLAS